MEVVEVLHARKAPPQALWKAGHVHMAGDGLQQDVATLQSCGGSSGVRINDTSVPDFITNCIFNFIDVNICINLTD